MSANNLYLSATKHTLLCLVACSIAHAAAHPLLERFSLPNGKLLQMLIMFLVAFSFSVPVQSLIMKLVFKGKWSDILTSAFLMSLITMLSMMIVEHGLLYLTSSNATHSHEHSHTTHESPPFFFISISLATAFCLTFYYNVRYHQKKS